MSLRQGFGLFLLLVGCGPVPAYPDHHFSTLQKRLFDVSCAASCHQTVNVGVSGQLNLSAGNAYSNLVNVPAKNVGAVDDGLMRVLPGDPDHSLLFIKIAGHTPVAYGTPMPQSGAAVSAEAVSAVRAWIEAGAPND